MSNPHIPFDPRDADPLVVLGDHGYPLIESRFDPRRFLTDIAIAEREAVAWDDGYAAAVSDRRWRAAELVLAALSGAGFVGLLWWVVG